MSYSPPPPPRPPIVLMSILREGKPSPALTAKVHKALSGLYAVHGVSAPPRLAPAAAAATLRASCPAETGTVLGGEVESREFVRRARLWAVPKGTDQPVVLDLYCARPECDLEAMLTEAAVGLAEPSTSKSARPWSRQPTYCQPQAPASAKPDRSGRLVLAVYGDKVPKSLAAHVAKELGGARTVEVMPVDKKFTGSKEQQKALLGGDVKAQVLGVESTSEGLMLWLYDGATDQVHQEAAMVKCEGCSHEKLAAEVARKAQDYLAHSFDGATTAVLYQAPPLACADFGDDLWSGQSGMTGGGRYIDPSTAKWMKGAVWGLFAASAATTVTLAILNETSVGDLTLDNRLYHQALTRPAWVGFGISALSLAIAIPTTYIAHRASRNQIRSGSKATSVTCPTQ